MPVYKFSLPRPNTWVEFLMGLPSDIIGMLIGARFYHIFPYMWIVGLIIANTCFILVYRYAFYRIAYDGSDQLNSPSWRFYAITLLLQILLLSFIVMGYF